MFLLHDHVAMCAFDDIHQGQFIASSFGFWRVLPEHFISLPFCQPAGLLVGLLKLNFFGGREGSQCVFCIDEAIYAVHELPQHHEVLSHQLFHERVSRPG